MKAKSTVILAIVTILIIGITIGIGIITTQPASPPQKPQTTTQPPKPLPTEEELKKKLATEQSAITAALLDAYPQLLTMYTINPGKLYHQGEWYGTTLTYYGTDEMNRDTLRVLMEKKGSEWQVLTKPPTIILRASDYPDAPKSVVQDINQPAPVPGTNASPAIN